MIGRMIESILEQDDMPIVICNLDHDIVYMNPAAKEHYSRHAGGELIGKCIFDCHSNESRDKIIRVVEWFGKSTTNNKVHTFYNEKLNKDYYMVALRDRDERLIGYYEKHESRNRDSTPFYQV